MIEATALVGVFAAYYQFSPNISVSPYPAFRASDPFDIPFIIANNGQWDLTNIQATCSLKSVLYTGPNNSKMEVIDSMVTTEQGKSKMLSPGEGLSAKCELKRLAFMKGTTIQNAEIGMIVRFSIAFFGDIERSITFVASKDEFGDWHWLPQPAIR